MALLLARGVVVEVGVGVEMVISLPWRDGSVDRLVAMVLGESILYKER
jgi:hypothetical protein